MASLRTTLATSLLGLAAASPLAAQPVTGLYIAGGGGLNWVQSSDLSVNGQAAATAAALGVNPSGTVDFDLGWVALGSLGWGFGNGLRIEAEGNFRQNNVDQVSGFGGIGAFTSTGGRQRSYGVMGNVLYDFDLGDPLGTGVRFVPYIGGGVGYVWTEWDGVRATTANGTQLNANGTDGQFAYQGIIGAAFPLTSVPGLSFTAEYRFMGTLSPEFKTSLSVPAGQLAAGGRVESDNFNHSVLLGLRYALYQPAPPAPPAPAVAPAPARTYLVFFDWNRADLTDRARQIIAEAAQNSRRVAVTRIEVNGYTDTSGSAQYNQRLSVRRAEAVAAELVRLGIARSEITTQGFGQTNLLVPTGDNVREPQNRRVEIILR